LKIAVKPLQMETWLLLTTYRKLPAPYPTVLSPTFYDLPFSHNTVRLACYSALWLFKVIQGQWFPRHLKANMWLLLVINNNLGPISHRLTTVHPWQTDGRTDDNHANT